MYHDSSRDTCQAKIPMPGLAMLALVLLFTLNSAVPAFSSRFTIASYNVENLFDAVYNGTEYPDYIPGPAFGWSKKMAMTKAANIARVVCAIDADILCLQEVESKKALLNLLSALPSCSGKNYPFYAITGAHTAVQCALLSVFPIIESEDIEPCPGCRAILKAIITIEGNRLVVFVVHWKSKSGPESLRLPYAKALRNAIEKLGQETDFVIAGDFNSNYDEYRTILKNPRLNDTGGTTGINHVLKTVWKGSLVTEATLLGQGRSELLLYNLWLELPEKRRWSYNFFGKKETPDSIIIPASLYDGKGVSYVDNSFERIMPDFIFTNHRLYRWQRASRGRGKHLGSGYSDHLPVRAAFTTDRPRGGLTRK